MSTNLPIEIDLHDGNMFIKNESSVTFVTLDDRNHGDENVGVVEVWAIVALGLPEINKDLAVRLANELIESDSEMWHTESDGCFDTDVKEVK